MRKIVQTVELDNHVLEIVEVTPPAGDSGPVYLIQRRFRRANGDLSGPLPYGVKGFQSIDAAEAGGRKWCAQ
jgi:hypothetical protein